MNVRNGVLAAGALRCGGPITAAFEAGAGLCLLDFALGLGARAGLARTPEPVGFASTPEPAGLAGTPELNAELVILGAFRGGCGVLDPGLTVLGDGKRLTAAFGVGSFRVATQEARNKPDENSGIALPSGAKQSYRTQHDARSALVYGKQISRTVPRKNQHVEAKSSNAL